MYNFNVENDFDEAMKNLTSGISQNSTSPYLLITKFDIFEKKNDTTGMSQALNELKNLIDNNIRTEIAYERRCLIRDAYEGKDINLLKSEMTKLKGMSEQAREKFERKLERISARKIK